MFHDPGHHIHNALRMTVGAVDDDDVNILLGQNLHALVITLTDGRGGAEAVAVITIVERLFVFNQGFYIRKTI